jgi:hypothetical protein
LTGDRAVDEMLAGYLTVVTGYNERAVRRVAADGAPFSNARTAVALP